MRVCFLGRRSGRRNSAPEGTGEQASPVSVLELRRGRRSHVPRRRRPPLHPSRVPYHEPCGCESFTQCLRRQVRRCFLQGRYTNRAQFRATSPPPPDLRFILAAGKPGKHWGSCERRLSQKQRTESAESRKTAKNRVFVSLPPFAQIREPAPALAFRADVKKARATSGLKLVVERMRIELTTSALRTRRSPS